MSHERTAVAHVNSNATAPSLWGTIDEIEARRIAVETQTDVRSVKKVVSGGHVRGLPGARIHRALAERAAKELA
jgi:hypothetical protein